MSDYDLSLTGAQIDAALSKVHNADSTPTNGSQNMITSDGVYDSISGFLTSSDLATDFTSPNNTTAPTTQAVQNLVTSNQILWARTQMNMSGQTGGLTWSNTIKHSSFTGFSTSGQQITIPSGKYFLNVTFTNANESSSASSANWYLMKNSQSGTQIFKGTIDNSTQTNSGSIIADGGNYFMKLVNGYVTGTVYVNVIKVQ